MHSIEDGLRRLFDHHLPSPSDFEMAISHDRILSKLRSTDPVRQQTRTTRPDARTTLWWRPAISVAAAAVVIALVVSVGMPLRHQAVYAVLEAADSSMYRISEGNRVPIRAGDRLAAHETLQSNGAAGAVLALADGSRIEIGSKSEMWWDRADGGLMVRLNSGSIIISATKEATSALYVATKDMTASVARTTSLVNAAEDGSSVGVIEGSAHVREGTVEKTVGAGQRLSTSPTLAALTLPEAIAWSRNADRHRAILAAFAKSMATTAGALTRMNQPAPAGQLDPRPRARAAEPAFEEASVRLCDPSAPPATPQGARGGGSGSLQLTPGHLNALCMTVGTLIRIAYGLGVENNPEALRLDFNKVYGLGNANPQVRSGPDWIRNERYTIEAVTNDSPNAQTMSGPMLRDLLERRFQLAAHVETEPVSAFALTIAPGGPKITTVDADACTPPAGAGPTPPPSDVADRVRRGETPTCGLIITGNGANTAVISGAAFWSQLIPMLTEILGSRVVDRTQLPMTERFNYVLEFAPDERTLGPLGGRGRGRDRISPQTSVGPQPPDLFTALREQLGLGLQSVQTPREYVVIDRIERPSPN